MRLNELTGVKQYYDKTMDKIVKALTSPVSTFGKAGSGVMARVFRHDSGMIYKFWVKDPAYEKYVAYCLDNQDNPHIPVFYSPIKELHSFFKRPIKFPDKIKYIKIEPLEEVKYGDTFPRNTKNSLKLYRIINSIDTSDGFFYLSKLARTVPNNQELLKQLRALRQIISDMQLMNGNIDLHPGNVMWRGNTLVITDPIVCWKALDFNEELGDILDDMKYDDSRRKTKSGPSYKDTKNQLPKQISKNETQ